MGCLAGEPSRLWGWRRCAFGSSHAMQHGTSMHLIHIHAVDTSSRSMNLSGAAHGSAHAMQRGTSKGRGRWTAGGTQLSSSRPCTVMRSRHPYLQAHPVAQSCRAGMLTCKRTQLHTQVHMPFGGMLMHAQVQNSDAHPVQC